MHKDIREAVDNAVELRVDCGCDEPQVFEPTTSGWRKAKAHQESHSPQGSSIQYILPEEK